MNLIRTRKCLSIVDRLRSGYAFIFAEFYSIFAAGLLSLSVATPSHIAVALQRRVELVDLIHSGRAWLSWILIKTTQVLRSTGAVLAEASER